MPKRSGKDDKNKRPIKFADIIQDPPKRSEEYLHSFRDQLEFGEVLVSDFQRGTLSKIDVAPCLIKEVTCA